MHAHTHTHTHGFGAILHFVDVRRAQKKNARKKKSVRLKARRSVIDRIWCEKLSGISLILKETLPSSFRDIYDWQTWMRLAKLLSDIFRRGMPREKFSNARMFLTLGPLNFSRLHTNIMLTFFTVECTVTSRFREGWSQASRCGYFDNTTIALFYRLCNVIVFAFWIQQVEVFKIKNCRTSNCSI